MDATITLRELLDVSEDIREAVAFDPEQATVAASTLEGEWADEAAEAIAQSAASMLRVAGGLRSGAEVTRLEAATPEGRVFVVASGDRAIAAVTDRDAMSQLVFHDLKRFLDA